MGLNIAPPPGGGPKGIIIAGSGEVWVVGCEARRERRRAGVQGVECIGIEYALNYYRFVANFGAQWKRSQQGLGRKRQLARLKGHRGRSRGAEGVGAGGEGDNAAADMVLYAGH